MKNISIEACLYKDRPFLIKKQKGKQSEKDQAEIEKRVARSLATVNQRQALALSFSNTQLPIEQYKADIFEALEKHQVIIVAGETGSGKSTQLPKYCLEAGRGLLGRIGHTQPRRIAARAIADRLSEELNSPLGEAVGYCVRFHEQVSDKTRVKVMTDGLLLNEIQSSKRLLDYDTIIIDEAHERSLNIDLLLGYLKRLLPTRPELKVIITSATISTQAFSDFFDGAPIIEVHGRTYPVDVFYLPKPDESDLFAHLVRTIRSTLEATQGDCLVFLSGEGEIRQAKKAIDGAKLKRCECLPLYARLNLNEQRKIFQTSSMRRVILATNIAETSLTVPNIETVVDLGFARVSRYSHKSKIQRLPIEPISKAAMKQRTGRAGRVRHGICYRLFTEDDYKTRDDFCEPEIQRTNLAQVILMVAKLRLGSLAEYPLMDPPNLSLINDGVRQLERLGALNDGRLTALGHRMARFPIEPKLAAILARAHEFHCMNEALIICAGLSMPDPKESAKDSDKAKQMHAKFADKRSSFSAYLKLWSWLETTKDEHSSSQFRKQCQQHYLNVMRVLEWQDIHRQLSNMAKGLKHKSQQKPATYEQVHQNLLCGLFESVGQFHPIQKHYRGPRGVSFHIPKHVIKAGEWVMAASLVDTGKVYGFIAANIEKHWIPKVLGHLCQYKTHDLFWQKSSGYVRAYQQVSFYGLMVDAKRACAIDEGDNAPAKTVFISQALMDHGLSYSFVKHNERVVERLKSLEKRVRRSYYLYDESMIQDWYETNLPPHVHNTVALSTFIRVHGEGVLQAKASDLVDVERIEAIERDYPDQIRIGQLDLNVSYAHDLNDESDGASIEIDQGMLSHLVSFDPSWPVPGILREKIHFVLTQIPKHYRTQLPSMKEVQRTLYEVMDRNVSFAQAWKKAFVDHFQVQISQALIEQIELPPHLGWHYHVLCEDGTIQINHDIESLDLCSGANVGAGAHEYGQTNIIKWDFGTLKPKEHTVSGQTVMLYPALVDEKLSVSIEYFSDEASSHSFHQKGLLRLWMLSQGPLTKRLKKDLQGLKDKAKKSFWLTGQDFVEDALQVIFTQAYAPLPMIYDQQSFEQHGKQGSKKLGNTLNQFKSFLNPLMEQITQLEVQLRQVKLKHAKTAQASIADVEQQITFLLGEGFIRHTPLTWLTRLPVYLKAISYRLDKIGQSPLEDWQKFKQLKPFIDACQSLKSSREDYRVTDYPWFLQEYRISLFAQALGTKMPISSKKLKQCLMKYS